MGENNPELRKVVVDVCRMLGVRPGETLAARVALCIGAYAAGETSQFVPLIAAAAYADAREIALRMGAPEVAAAIAKAGRLEAVAVRGCSADDMEPPAEER